MSRRGWALSVVAVSALGACISDASSPLDNGRRADEAAEDVGAAVDATRDSDAAPGPDAAQAPQVDAPDAAAPALDAGTSESGGCASPRVETWIGSASRINEYYPDNIQVSVTWQRVESDGCVDHYVPTGDARYVYAIPGALCGQSIDPLMMAVASTDGSLTIDRSTTPPTYAGTAATTWAVTWTCRFPDGSSNSSSFDGGGLWFEASGAVADTEIVGSYTVEEGLCGRGHSSLPCTYEWSFMPAE